MDIQNAWARSGPGLSRTAHVAASLLVVGALGLSACGGGGGAEVADSGTPTGVAGGGTEVPTAPAAVAIAPLVDGPDVYRFAVDETMADESAVAQAVGGPVFAAWNPKGSADLLAPGMKVTFFGHAEGCDEARDAGPVTADAGPTRAEALRRAAMAAAANGLTWTPLADAPGCEPRVAGRIGPSLVHLNPDRAQGGVAMFTGSGPRGDNEASFFGPFEAAGQNGEGANAHIVGTFVALRQDWRAADPLQPWGRSATVQTGVARIVARQSVGSARVGDFISADQTVQAKQQVTATFLNTACMREASTVKRPCQLNYLFTTAIFRAGVTDWGLVDWFNEATVWFDPAQGGVPIVEGPVRSAGTTVRDGDSNLALFSSQGEATQHSSFANRSFDLRISFAQLGNALRIVSGRRAGVAPGAVQAGDLAGFWGSRWNDPSAWVLLSVTTGQEVYNPAADRAAWIGGRLREVYVGPQS